jgi:hypothetical protein
MVRFKVEGKIFYRLAIGAEAEHYTNGVGDPIVTWQRG